MYKQSDAALTAWRATERTLDGKVTITDSSGNETDYATSDITSIAYDSGAWTGDTFSIGSTYENNITVTFAHLVEGLKQGYKVAAKIGIKLPDGTYEYCPLGVFIISDEITMDRNNDATTIKAYDQFCVMQGTYTSKLTYPAKVTDVIAEIANMSGVTLNTNDIAELPTQTDLASAISGQTYCTAIGWIAQFYGGFALFDRDGKLTIRTVTDASYILDASQYEQSGLTKNEATYQIGGMSVSVTTSTIDSTGESSETTSTLTAGETTGSQIELTNNVMTQTRLDSIWSTIKDITFYPYSLTWFGNPAIEAGDWLTLKDTKGNSFNVPNNSYTMTFDGGLTATSKADQTSTSSSSYSYLGTLSQTVKELAGRIGATGNYIFGTDATEEPATAKIGDQWYKQNGNKVELWQYVRQPDGTGKWTLIVSDLTSVEISENVDKAMSEADTAKQNANTAVETGNQALTKAQSAIDAANAAADNANTANANASTALNNAATAIQQAQSAANDATSATNIANAVKQDVTTLKDGSTMTIAELESGLALKITKDDMNTALQPYATQSWTSTKISATANEINSSIASVKKTADGNATDVTSLKQRADGFDTSINNLNSTKADQSWTTNQIKASSDSLNLTIASVQTQVNNSAVGTNLLTNSSFSYATAFTSWTTTGTVEFYLYNSIKTAAVKYSGSTTANPNYSEVYQTVSGLNVGQTYTLQFYILFCSANTKFDLIAWNNSGDSHDVSYSYTNNGSINAKKILTFTAKSYSLNVYLRVYSGTVYFSNGKLELGSYATDWSANPADNATVTSVTAISATVNGLATTVSGKVDNTTYTSKMTQLDNAISTKVESSDYNSKMTQLDNAISSKVSSSDYNTEVTQLSNMINSKVSTSDWQNSAVGANLLMGTKDFSTSLWHNVNHSSWVDPNGNTATLKDNSAWNGTYQPYWIIKGETYTFSCYYFANFKDGEHCYFYPNENNGTAVDDGSNSHLSAPIIAGNTWIYMTYTFTAIATGNFCGRLELAQDSGVVYSASYKLEKGSYATPWCPAASEIANYSQIQQLSDNINLRVQKNDVINQINVSSESILISGNKIHITGSTTIDNAVIKSAMIDSISADKITAGTLNAANVSVINLNADNISSGTLTGVSFHQSSSGMDTWIDGNGIHNYNNSGGGVWIRNGMLEADGGTNGNAYISGDFGNLAFVSPDKHTLSVSEISGVGYYTGYDSVSNQGSGTMIANISLANDATTLPTIVQSLYGIQIIDKSYGSSIDMSISGLHLSSSDSLAVDVFGKGMYVYTDFYVSGSKNAIVQTSAGWAKINAYETAEYYFGDIGETETGAGCEAKIVMDSLFLETVNTSVGYQVFITPYSDAKIWVDERNSDNFVVKSDTANAKFAYEIKAKRKGYENTRLEIDKDFGKEAA